MYRYLRVGILEPAGRFHRKPSRRPLTCQQERIASIGLDAVGLGADRAGGHIALRRDPLNELGEYFVGHVRSLNVL